uniref:AsnC family transcriptional regulator n=1 Tax=Schistosoma curassoni TaxID=6186 RepID=A0A183JSE0_9TREM
VTYNVHLSLNSISAVPGLISKISRVSRIIPTWIVQNKL